MTDNGSTSLVTREIKIKTTTRHLLGWLKKKTLKILTADKNVELMELSYNPAIPLLNIYTREMMT